MREKRKEKQSDGYQFINERIVPKRKKKWLRRLGTMVFVIGMAIVFGVVARAAYLLSEDYLKDLFEIEDKRQEVELPKSASPTKNTLTSKPAKEPTPGLASTNPPETMLNLFFKKRFICFVYYCIYS